MEYRKFASTQLVNSFDRFELTNPNKTMTMIHPWRELVIAVTGKKSFNRRTYIINELPLGLTRAIYTNDPSRHITKHSVVTYLGKMPCVLLDDQGDWDEFKQKHMGDDVIAFAELDLNK